MDDTRLQHVTNHLDAADEHRDAMNAELRQAEKLIAAITAERTSTSTPQDFDSLERAGMHIMSAIALVAAADDRNREGITMKGLRL